MLFLHTSRHFGPLWVLQNKKVSYDLPVFAPLRSLLEVAAAENPPTSLVPKSGPSLKRPGHLESKKNSTIHPMSIAAFVPAQAGRFARSHPTVGFCQHPSGSSSPARCLRVRSLSPGKVVRLSSKQTSATATPKVSHGRPHLLAQTRSFAPWPSPTPWYTEPDWIVLSETAENPPLSVAHQFVLPYLAAYTPHRVGHLPTIRLCLVCLMVFKVTGFRLALGFPARQPTNRVDSQSNRLMKSWRPAASLWQPAPQGFSCRILNLTSASLGQPQTVVHHHCHFWPSNCYRGQNRKKPNQEGSPNLPVRAIFGFAPIVGGPMMIVERLTVLKSNCRSPNLWSRLCQMKDSSSLHSKVRFYRPALGHL